MGGNPYRQSMTSGTGDIQCPFFVAHSQKAIICEADVDIPRVTQAMRFRSGAEKRKHEDIYCSGNYRMCEHYRAVMAKYED